MFTLAEGEISELHVGLKGTMNALFLKDLAKKTHRGLRGRIEKGFSAGAVGYGYRMIRRLTSEGELVRGEREIDYAARSEEHTSELQSLMRISYAVFCLKQN